ncbi:SDR family oxidoreductase [Pelagicoccus sp. SDUM812005]|uniref:SDR family oxidoreductase n=1 Tax=Pelagicoccus sp. SDUM812005 TaxID=3041257 RepID=UPI00280F7B9E|nr:SDR family oxidoreductase [Pelagicoccus sp. SDUM812005]MDQ8182945.1 SDR family oxidoreductase [Pelagicoccus sp. SDUM812005]
MNTLKALFSLEGKVALVTGGYRGLGLSIAEALAEAGALVVLNGRSESGVKAAVQAFEEKGLKADAAVFDVMDETAITKAVADISANHGGVDILVNNAGIHRRNLMLDMPPSDFKLVLDTNVTAAFMLGKAVAPGMIEKGGGKIINIHSLMSELARKSIANYAAAKGAIQMLTRSMTAEWATHNIQANGIGPGYFDTEMTKPLIENPEFNNWLVNRTPSGRWGVPDDLKGLAIFLASPASNYVNGQTIFVDGGLTAVV